MHFRYKLFFYIVILLQVGLKAQIYSPDADTIIPTVYTISSNADSVFIFKRSEYRVKDPVIITAVSPDSTTGWTFKWDKFNSTTISYDSIGSGTGISHSIDTITSAAGYRVAITKTAQPVFIQRIWIVFNDFNVEITSKDNDGNVAPGKFFCGLIEFNAQKTEEDLRYFHPTLDTFYTIDKYNSDYNYQWIPNPDMEIRPSNRLNTYFTSPPYEDTEFVLHAIDRYGLERTDTVFYISIETKAEAGIDYIPLYDTAIYPEIYGMYYNENYYGGNVVDTNAGYPAPATIKFYDDESKNATSYEWNFGTGKEYEIYDGDTSLVVGPDTIVYYQYHFPGSYTVVYKTTSNYGCIDTTSENIVLLPPSFSPGDSIFMPNVFTPRKENDVFKAYLEEDDYNAYLENDIFRPYDISIQDFSIFIINRYGQKVHSYQGLIRDWPGWDGKIRNSNRDAASGVYFYVIDMIVGWERIDSEETIRQKYLNKTYSGFFHLFREDDI